ncbi:hypothetical protein JX265_011901 [Neoarthrinium moseri]|uniref:Uncharacterized protein n=1 Tax=Neoarthrinium moseri TaxID=1658444 RepID=A0A9Q0AH56_9PEZI|nr:hypothetical protein JX265_011901 [Neoarthrinium moseri]
MPYPLEKIAPYQFDWKQPLNSLTDYQGSDTSCESQTCESPSIASQQTALYRPVGREESLATEQHDPALDLVTTHQNLTMMSQFLLKLETRTKTVSKIDVRRTLDAISNNRQYTAEMNNIFDCRQLVDDIRELTSDLYARIFDLDHEMKKMSRENRDAAGQSMSFQLHGESYVKKWIQLEIDNNAKREGETCWYTVKDLKAQRHIREWMEYLRRRYGAGNALAEEYELVKSAWSYLDRSLRPPWPRYPISVNDFIEEWNSMRAAGAFECALEDPARQNREDEVSLITLRDLWTDRMAHQSLQSTK